MIDREKDFDLTAGGTILFKLFGILFAIVAGGIVSILTWAAEEGEGIDETTGLILLGGVAFLSIFAAFYRYRLVLSNRRREVLKGYYLGVIPLRRKRRSYDLFDRLEMTVSVTDSDANKPYSERRVTARETRFVIDLVGRNETIYLYDTLTRESAEEMIDHLSEYTGFKVVPLSD